MFRQDHQRDAEVMQYGQSPSKAVGRNHRLVGVRNKLHCETGGIAWVRGPGWWECEAIEKIKALMAPFTDRWEWGSLEPLNAWHPFTHETLEGSKSV